MRTTRMVIVGVTFLIGCAVGGASSRYVAPPASAQQGYPRWEYYCFHSSQGIFYQGEGLSQEANKLGAQGWEMVAAAGGGSQTEMHFAWCFKRPAR